MRGKPDLYFLLVDTLKLWTKGEYQEGDELDDPAERGDKDFEDQDDEDDKNNNDDDEDEDEGDNKGNEDEDDNGGDAMGEDGVDPTEEDDEPLSTEQDDQRILRKAIRLCNLWTKGNHVYISGAALSTPLAKIPRTSALEKLTVEDPYAEESYLGGLRQFGLKSMILHGTYYLLQLPPEKEMEDDWQHRAYSSEDWPNLHKFEGCIKSLVHILPNRPSLTKLCIVDSGISEIGLIEEELRRLEMDEEKLDEVYGGLRRVEILEILVAKPRGGAFQFADVSTPANQPQMFLEALGSVKTLSLPAFMLRDARVRPIILHFRSDW